MEKYNLIQTSSILSILFLNKQKWWVTRSQTKCSGEIKTLHQQLTTRFIFHLALAPLRFPQVLHVGLYFYFERILVL